MKQVSQNNAIIAGLALLFAVLLGIAGVLGTMVLNQEGDPPIDFSVADNNCCSQPDCPEYNGDWEAGFYACLENACAKCSTPSTCGNNVCDPGESLANCASDCDEKGFSELPVNTACDPSARVDGFSQCIDNQANTNFPVGQIDCFACAANTENAGQGFCVTSSDNSLCGPVVSPACGNGTVEEGEQCDDGNTTAGDGCSATCQNEPVCGNGTIESGEECDDGNTANGDGCSAICILENVAGNQITCTRCTVSLSDGNACDTVIFASEICPQGYQQGSNCAIITNCPVDVSVTNPLPSTAIDTEALIPVLLSIVSMGLGILLFVQSGNVKA